MPLNVQAGGADPEQIRTMRPRLVESKATERLAAEQFDERECLRLKATEELFKPQQKNNA